MISRPVCQRRRGDMNGMVVDTEEKGLPKSAAILSGKEQRR